MKRFAKISMNRLICCIITMIRTAAALLLVVSCSIVNTKEQSISDRNEDLKVLIIGNSYSEDAVAMLPLLVDSSKVDVSNLCIYKVIRGSASFKRWVDIYNDRDSLSSYYVDNVLGGLKSNIRKGVGKAGDGSLFRALLTDEKWDLIVLNQVSTYAADYDLWKTDGNGGCLNQLLAIINQHQPQATIGFLLIHSYAGNGTASSLSRWHSIAESVRKLTNEYNIGLIIPYGTAIQNLRASSFNNEFDLTRDGSHCGYGLCRYTAACCFFESVLAPFYGVSVMGNNARYDASEDKSSNPAVDVTDRNAPVAQKAALLAVEHWDQCINPEK